MKINDTTFLKTTHSTSPTPLFLWEKFEILSFLKNFENSIPLFKKGGRQYNYAVILQAYFSSLISILQNLTQSELSILKCRISPSGESSLLPQKMARPSMSLHILCIS